SEPGGSRRGSLRAGRQSPIPRVESWFCERELRKLSVHAPGGFADALIQEETAGFEAAELLRIQPGDRVAQRPEIDPLLDARYGEVRGKGTILPADAQCTKRVVRIAGETLQSQRFDAAPEYAG